MWYKVGWKTVGIVFCRHENLVSRYNLSLPVKVVGIAKNVSFTLRQWLNGEFIVIEYGISYFGLVAIFMLLNIRNIRNKEWIIFFRPSYDFHFFLKKTPRIRGNNRSTKYEVKWGDSSMNLISLIMHSGKSDCVLHTIVLSWVVGKYTENCPGRKE